MHTCRAAGPAPRPQVSLERSRGNLSGAIEALRKYLDVMANDKDGWEELAELYLEVGRGLAW